MKKNIFKVGVLTFLVMTIPLVSKAGDLTNKPSNPVIRVTPPAPKFSIEERHEELAARRRRVADKMTDNSMLILLSAESKLYANDVDYHYRQENNLYYLTALKQNGVSLVIAKIGGKVTELLFLPNRNPRFETWNGKMYSEQDAIDLSGIKTLVDAGEFTALIDSLKKKSQFVSQKSAVKLSLTPSRIYVLNGNKREFYKENELAEQLESQVDENGGKLTIVNAMPLFATLRLVKSPYEIKLMRHAIDITTEAFGRSMGMIGRANWEYEVQAEVEYTFRRRNADFWGYPSIVGCGPNATTLHYVESQGKVNHGDLMLMDVGAEYDHYTADITRTFPVSGKFTKEQAAIYQIVFDAQEAAARELRPGSSIGAAAEAARMVIVEGLFKLGLITDINSNQYRLWYMHGWGHWIGMNVHDVGNYGTSLKEGMMMSNEPGIYIRADALDFLPDTDQNREFLAKVRPAFEKYKNIGVRIEDDMLITANGVEWMSRHLPRSIADVEGFMEAASKEMKYYAGGQKPESRGPSFLDERYRSAGLKFRLPLRTYGSSGAKLRRSLTHSN